MCSPTKEMGVYVLVKQKIAEIKWEYIIPQDYRISCLLEQYNHHMTSISLVNTPSMEIGEQVASALWSSLLWNMCDTCMYIHVFHTTTQITYTVVWFSLLEPICHRLYGRLDGKTALCILGQRGTSYYHWCVASLLVEVLWRICAWCKIG